jgi:hypothetical protein
MVSDSAVGAPSVLLAFRGSNVRSFRDELELSMLATRLSDPAHVREVRVAGTTTPIRVLPVAAVIGANASGKTNVMRVMNDMREHVLHSFRRLAPQAHIPRRRFQLDSECGDRPSRYEVDLVLDGVRLQYGFAVDDDQVLEEWAFRYPNGRRERVFQRELQTFEMSRRDVRTNRTIESITRPNALFLSTAASANHPVLTALYQWFERNLTLADVDSRTSRQAYTANLLGQDALRQPVLDLLRAADLGIVDARRVPPDPAVAEFKARIVRAVVGEFGDGGETPKIELEQLVRFEHLAEGGRAEIDPNDESHGTLVWFGLIGPVAVALRDGSVLLADELDASLHPSLVARLVQLFQDSATNPRRAQLVCNTHDVTLLGDSRSRVLGRDQVWLTEKSSDGASSLYPLSDFAPRGEESIATRYLAGRYGGVPVHLGSEFEDAVASLFTVPS